MAFAGNIGAAGGFIDAAAIFSRPPGVSTLQMDADGNLEGLNANGSRVYGGPIASGGSIRYLNLALLSTPLQAYAGTGTSSAGADVGVLSTADPIGVNDHGLPRNFGPGAGNWTDELVRQVNVAVTLTDINNTPSGGGDVVIDRVTNVVTSFQVAFKNYNAQSIVDMRIAIWIPNSTQW